MANEYGDKNAEPPTNSPPSSNTDSHIIVPGDDVPKLLGSSDITLDETIQMHLTDCWQCRSAIVNDRPRAIGQRSGHCDIYWGLQLLRAQFEGSVNNIVAYTEYGDEAPKGHGLE